MRGALLPRINRLVDFDVAGLKIASCRSAGTSVGAVAIKTDTSTVTSGAARGAHCCRPIAALRQKRAALRLRLGR